MAHTFILIEGVLWVCTTMGGSPKKLACGKWAGTRDDNGSGSG
jgi:hypothetical protein